MKHKRLYIYLTACIFFLYGIQVVYSKSRPRTTLPILGFHHIAPDAEAEANFPHNMWVTKLSTFEEEMKYLYEQGYHTLTLDEVYAWRMGHLSLPEKSVVITFDDGFLSSIHYAQPILEKYGFHGSVFAIASSIKEHGPYDATIRQHASLSDINASSLDFYSHTYDLHHKNKGFRVDQMKKSQLEADIEKSNQLVSSEYLAYPYGHANDTLIEVLKQKGTKLAFGFNENKKASIKDDPYRLPRFCVNRYTTLEVFQAMLEGS